MFFQLLFHQLSTADPDARKLVCVCLHLDVLFIGANKNRELANDLQRVALEALDAANDVETTEKTAPRIDRIVCMASKVLALDAEQELLERALETLRCESQALFDT